MTIEELRKSLEGCNEKAELRFADENETIGAAILDWECGTIAGILVTKDLVYLILDTR